MNAMKSKNEEKKKIIEREFINPVYEAINKDARNRPEVYVRNYRIPTEGE